MLFQQWLNEHMNGYNFGFETSLLSNKKCIFATWSDWDLGICLRNECKRKRIKLLDMFNKWIDVRALYRVRYINNLNLFIYIQFIVAIWTWKHKFYSIDSYCEIFDSLLNMTIPVTFRQQEFRLCPSVTIFSFQFKSVIKHLLKTQTAFVNIFLTTFSWNVNPVLLLHSAVISCKVSLLPGLYILTKCLNFFEKLFGLSKLLLWSLCYI